MKLMGYKELVPIGTCMIIFAAGFGLGAVYSNLPYDVETLWSYSGNKEVFQHSFDHYLKWANAPAYVHYILHSVFVIGVVGSLIKIYKPSDDSKYFEYGCLGLLVLSIVIYLTNLRTGINSCYYENWGEVPKETGLNVIGASQFMIVVLLIGVLVLQGGLYYAEWYDGQLKIEFYQQNPDYKEINGQPVKISDIEGEEAPEAITSSSTASETKAEKKKTKKSKK